MLDLCISLLEKLEPKIILLPGPETETFSGNMRLELLIHESQILARTNPVVQTEDRCSFKVLHLIINYFNTYFSNI